jgi:hypothetical protein
MTTNLSSQNPGRFWSAFRLRYALDQLGLAIKAYDPDQPRAPGGTEEGGQWISVDGELNPIVIAGGFKKEHMDMTVQDFISKMCKGYIYGEIPEQFLPLTIEELLAAKRAGVVDSNTCFKLLHRDKYRK